MIISISRREQANENKPHEDRQRNLHCAASSFQSCDTVVEHEDLLQESVAIVRRAALRDDTNEGPTLKELSLLQLLVLQQPPKQG
jgi:hypothetical protein